MDAWGMTTGGGHEGEKTIDPPPIWFRIEGEIFGIIHL